MIWWAGKFQHFWYLGDLMIRYALVYGKLCKTENQKSQYLCRSNQFLDMIWKTRSSPSKIRRSSKSGPVSVDIFWSNYTFNFLGIWSEKHGRNKATFLEKSIWSRSETKASFLGNTKRLPSSFLRPTSTTATARSSCRRTTWPSTAGWPPLPPLSGPSCTSWSSHHRSLR